MSSWYWFIQLDMIITDHYHTLTHRGRVTHIWVSNLTIVGSDNGLSPGWSQAIVWTNAEILLIGPWGTNFGEFLIEIYPFTIMHLEMSSAKWRPFGLGLNVLNTTMTGVGKRWVGVTKPISPISLFSEFFDIVKTLVKYRLSRWYLTVTPVKYECDSKNLKGRKLNLL